MLYGVIRLTNYIKSKFNNGFQITQVRIVCVVLVSLPGELQIVVQCHPLQATVLR